VNESSASSPEKTKENRLRRVARREGYFLRKSRRRDVWSPDFGRYYVVDPRTNIPAFESDDLDAIERWLSN